MLGVCNNRLIANLWRHLKKDIWKKRHINRQNSVKKKELSLKKKMCSSVEEFIASGAVSSITLATDCTMGNDQEEEWGRSKRRGGRGRKKEGKGEKERKREKGRKRKRDASWVVSPTCHCRSSCLDQEKGTWPCDLPPQALPGQKRI